MFRRTMLAAAALLAVASTTAAPAHANHGTGSSPVVGYIYITYNTALGQTAPSYQLFGALAAPALWTCSDNLSSGYPAVPYAVTCVPTSTAVNLAWHCDVLHADIAGLSPTASAHTSLDCNGDGTPEAQTVYVAGVLYDFVWATNTMPVSKFVCTVDGKKFGVTGAATPDYRAGCGDPGVVRFFEIGRASCRERV